MEIQSKQAEIKERMLGKAFIVKASISTLSMKQAEMKKAMAEFDLLVPKLEKFLKILEKKFGEVIWYIGTDLLDGNIVERFLFHKSGFMEISLSRKTLLKAFFPDKKKAEKFAKALEKTAKKLKINLKRRVK